MFVIYISFFVASPSIFANDLKERDTDFTAQRLREYARKLNYKIRVESVPGDFTSRTFPHKQTLSASLSNPIPSSLTLKEDSVFLLHQSADKSESGLQLISHYSLELDTLLNHYGLRQPLQPKEIDDQYIRPDGYVFRRSPNYRYMIPSYQLELKRESTAR